MECELRRIPLVPLIKVVFFVFLLLGFIMGIFYAMVILSMVSVMGSALDFGERQVFDEFSGLGFIGVIFMGFFMGIFSAVMSAIFSAIGAACYNLLAGWLGGVKLELHGGIQPPPIPREAAHE